MPALVVGVPKEIKDNENRVAVQPDGIAELV
jgi:alanine dehydrogenase